MKPFKFLHTADWHFGACRRLTPKSLEYLERHKAILKRVLKRALKDKVDFILVAGDIFENAATTIDEMVAAYEIFRMAGEIAPTIVTAGNHDELAVGNFQTEWMRILEIPNVTFVSKPKIVEVAGVKVAAIPWTGLKDQDAFDQVLADTVEDSPICMLHECFVGITLDSGLVAKGGVKIPNIPTVRYYACGDIHKHQRVQLDRAWYSGAPMQYNFGDHLPKGCMIVDVDKDGIYTPRFIEIASHIELHNIISLDQIPADSPHWYKLRIDAVNMPKHAPTNVKIIEPIPRKIDMPVVAKPGEEPGDLLTEVMAVDFSEGVADLLHVNQFSPEEIAMTIAEVQEVVARS